MPKGISPDVIPVVAEGAPEVDGHDALGVFARAVANLVGGAGPFAGGDEVALGIVAALLARHAC